MKNPYTQTAISIIGGLATTAVLMLLFGTENKLYFGLSLTFGLGAYFAISMLLSQTPEEIQADMTKIEMASQYKDSRSAIERIEKCINRAYGCSAVMEHASTIVRYAHQVLEDLIQKPDMPRVTEFVDYIVDFADAFEGYCGIKEGTITARLYDRNQIINNFEGDLPSFVQGFEELAASVDQNESTLAEMKRRLLKNKMMSNGRIGQ